LVAPFFLCDAVVGVEVDGKARASMRSCSSRRIWLTPPQGGHVLKAAGNLQARQVLVGAAVEGELVSHSYSVNSLWRSGEVVVEGTALTVTA
jgi:hypothetical protein